MEAEYTTMESLVHYSNPSHALSVLGVLNEQRLRGQMCDVVLVVADQRYQAHKSVLAASSEYFQTLFTRRDAESLKVEARGSKRFILPMSRVFLLPKIYYDECVLIVFQLFHNCILV
uniref:Zinc finger and BTB domain containing 21 n=1 Tax=Labrus bergylta TaxID=56723 RepID=A0A3Q3M969_9LABR